MEPSKPPTGLLIRRASEDDLLAIVSLLKADSMGNAREDLGPPLPDSYVEAFREIAADPRCALMVAELDGVVVGTFQRCFLRHLTFRGARVAQLESVHVAAPRRGQGIGNAMMQWAIEEARAAGCNRVQLTSHKSRTDSHRFYHRLGFVASHEGMKLFLG